MVKKNTQSGRRKKWLRLTAISITIAVATTMLLFPAIVARTPLRNTVVNYILADDELTASAARGATWWNAWRRFTSSGVHTQGISGQVSEISKARIRLVVEGVVFSAAVAFCMVQVAVPRRLAQTGHTEAARWIAQNTPQDAVLLDTYGWSSLLSDRESYQYESLRQAFLDPRLRYVVLQADELQENTNRASSLRMLLDLGGSLRRQFPGSTGGPEKTVSIYEWSPSRAVHRMANRVDRPKTAKGI